MAVGRRCLCYVGDAPAPQSGAGLDLQLVSGGRLFIPADASPAQARIHELTPRAWCRDRRPPRRRLIRSVY